MDEKKTNRNKRRASAQLIKKLRERVRELEETYLAIRRGRVDALVVSGLDGDQVFTLQGAEHPYRVLVETMNDGAATLNTDGMILYANASLAKFLGVALHGLIGTALQNYFSEADQNRLKVLIDEAFRGESCGELSVIGPDNKMHLVRLSMSLVQNSDLRTICVVTTDLTELSVANEALKSSEDRLRNLSGRLLRLQDEERRRISRDLHDITGQKLALLSMNLSAIASSKSIPKHAEVRRLISESMVLSNEVNKEIRTLSYVLHPPLLDELGLSSAVQWLTQGFENRTGIRVSVDIPSNFVRLLPDAEVALFRVVQESLSNVHRYSESATAFVRARSDGGNVILEIGDFGKGMSQDSRLSGFASEITLGVGIQGMKERLRQLSGTLEIFSEPAKGTLVIATLPMANQRADIPEEEHGEHEVRPATAARVGSNGGRKRILVADDHDVLRRGIRTMLEDEPDLEVCDEAVNGRDALEKTLAQDPDLLILDLNMPILNGIEVVRQIVRRRPKTKILAFSVHDSKQIVEEIIAAGAHAYLSKATAGQHLVQQVHMLLDQRIQIPPE